MKKIIILFMLAILAVSVDAREKKHKFEIADTLTDAFLDTVQVKKKLRLNDYSLIGVQYGAALSQVMWNPTQSQNMLLIPMNVGVTYTLYGKMFGYMPYFGFQTGIFYAREGYEFEYNEERHYTNTIEGAEKAIMDVLEVPILSHIHFDFWHFKIIAQIGMFAGYRMSIERFPGITGNVNENVAHSFIKTDNPKGSFVFDNTSEDLCIYIPLGSLNKYKNRKYFEGHEHDDPEGIGILCFEGKSLVF